MGSNTDYLRTYFDEQFNRIPEAGIEWSETHFSDDFQFIDKGGNVLMDKAGYLGFARLLVSSFKDLKYVYSGFTEEGDDVTVRAHWEGTFTGDFDLSAMGMGVVKANGKKIVWPDSSGKWKFKGDKIVSIQDLSEGGMGEFLAPLGVKPPSA